MTAKKQSAILTKEAINVGNRLQNYALQKTLESLQWDCETLLDLSLKKPGLKSALGRLRGAFLSNLQGEGGRSRCFRTFDEELVRFSKCKIEEASYFLSKSPGKIVIGSDQVWNFNWGLGSRVDGSQCAFAVPAGSKIAYAASFGISLEDMPDVWRRRYAEWLRHFDPGMISMREDEGVRIVRELSGHDAPVVLDPTMLLTSEAWIEIEKRPQIRESSDHFCLKYVLGDDMNNKLIDSLASKHGLPIVDLSDRTLPIGPAEFLWLVHHCDLMCTDSFHGTVFSLLFHRPFVIYEREQEKQCDMSSRFDTLGRVFGINERRYSSPEFVLDSVWNWDKGAFEAVLAGERELSMAWLKAALDGPSSKGSN